MASYWETIVNFYKTDPELSDWITSEDGGNLESISLDVMRLWKEVTLYQGFDVKRILKLARASYTTYMSTKIDKDVSLTVKIGGKDKVFKYTNGEPMSKDLHFLFFLFANRGCSWDKVVKKSNSETMDILEWLKEKYTLDTQTRASGSSLSPDLITIPRLTACFPTVYCDIFAAGQAKEVVKPGDIDLPDGVSRAVLCPMFVACIPPNCVQVDKNIHIVSLCVTILLDDILHKRAGTQTDLEQLFSYYKAAYNSPSVPDDGRLMYMQKLNLVVRGAKHFVTALLDMVAPCEDKIRASRSSDASLDSVIKEAKALKAKG